jgi:hypothetical protein
MNKKHDSPLKIIVFASPASGKSMLAKKCANVREYDDEEYRIGTDSLGDVWELMRGNASEDPLETSAIAWMIMYGGPEKYSTRQNVLVTPFLGGLNEESNFKADWEGPENHRQDIIVPDDAMLIVAYAGADCHDEYMQRIKDRADKQDLDISRYSKDFYENIKCANKLQHSSKEPASGNLLNKINAVGRGLRGKLESALTGGLIGTRKVQGNFLKIEMRPGETLEQVLLANGINLTAKEKPISIGE